MLKVEGQGERIDLNEASRYQYHVSNYQRMRTPQSHLEFSVF